MSLLSSLGSAVSGVLGASTGSIGGSLLSGGLSLLGSSLQNSANKSAASDQMAFQQYMSNTSYQRVVSDMEKAGLNPMLAYSQGGASTPSGSTYSAVNELGAGVSSALAARQLAAQIKQIDASTDKLEADTFLARQQAISETYKQVNTQANTNLTNVSREIANYNVNSAKANAAAADIEAKIDRSGLGESLRKMNRVLSTIGLGTSSYSDVARSIGK